jgi:hypothetical protein
LVLNVCRQPRDRRAPARRGHDRIGGTMNGIIYLVGLVVVVIAVLSFFGLR